MATIDLGKIKQVWRGTYNNSTAYTVDDLVEYTDTGITSTYICVANSTGNAPSSSGTAHASWNYVAKGVADPKPSQSGNAGKVLKTDGSAASWGVADPSKLVNYAQEFKTDTASQSIAWIGYGASVWTNDLIYLDYAAASSSNKLLIISHLSWAVEDGYNYSGFFGVLCVGGTHTARGDEISGWGTTRASLQHSNGVTNNRVNNNDVMHSAVHNYLHTSPSTSSTRYSWRFAHTNGSANKGIYLNRAATQNSNAGACTATSSITIMEFLP